MVKREKVHIMFLNVTSRPVTYRNFNIVMKSTYQSNIPFKRDINDTVLLNHEISHVSKHA